MYIHTLQSEKMPSLPPLLPSCHSRQCESNQDFVKTERHTKLTGNSFNFARRLLRSHFYFNNNGMNHQSKNCNLYNNKSVTTYHPHTLSEWFIK